LKIIFLSLSLSLSLLNAFANDYSHAKAIACAGKDTKVAYDILLDNLQIVIVDDELSLQAGLLHFGMSKTAKDFGLADA